MARACLGANFYPLAHYLQNFWAMPHRAYTFAGYEAFKPLFPGQGAVWNSLVSIVDDAASEVISSPQTGGREDIFRDANCAGTGGCGAGP
jgi:hypothetical protein